MSVKLQASYLTSLNFSFRIYKTGIIMPTGHAYSDNKMTVDIPCLIFRNDSH